MDRNTLKTKYLAVNFVGLSLIASVFLYAVIVEVVKRWLAPFAGFGGLTPATADMLFYVFLVMALGHYVVIRVIDKVVAGKSPAHLPQGAIISLALCEAVALYGLVLFLLAGNANHFYIFMALALLLFYLFFPRYDQWEKVLPAAIPPKRR